MICHGRTRRSTFFGSMSFPRRERAEKGLGLSHELISRENVPLLSYDDALTFFRFDFDLQPTPEVYQLTLSRYFRVFFCQS